MDAFEIAAFLLKAPADHQRRSELAHRAMDEGRWPAAACGLRQVAALAREWADKAAQLADHCDTQAESGRTASTVPTSLVEITEPGTLLEHTGPLTVEALEAAVMALAHSVGREHAVRARRAMVNVLRSQTPGA